MGLRKWLKLTFLIDKNFEDLIIWKLSELRILSYAFNFLENEPSSLRVEIWLLESICNDQFKFRLEKIFENLLKDNHYSQSNFYWEALDEDWMNSWKNFWGPEPVGTNFLVLPAWMDLPSKFDSKKVIKIDPGAAFGTGSHPSTYLCLQEIEKIQIRSRKILDIGCGSGILTIAAKLLGGNNLFALDTDYLAINSAKENIKLNFGNSPYIDLYEGSFQEFIFNKQIKDFDLVMCNILADVIKEIIPSISSVLNVDGEIILSGILSSQQREIIKILNLNYLSVDNVSSRKDWVCIKAKKKKQS